MHNCQLVCDFEIMTTTYLKRMWGTQWSGGVLVLSLACGTTWPLQCTENVEQTHEKLKEYKSPCEGKRSIKKRPNCVVAKHSYHWPYTNSWFTWLRIKCIMPGTESVWLYVNHLDSGADSGFSEGGGTP